MGLLQQQLTLCLAAPYWEVALGEGLSSHDSATETGYLPCECVCVCVCVTVYAAMCLCVLCACVCECACLRA
jgi:hypothetical protein